MAEQNDSKNKPATGVTDPSQIVPVKEKIFFALGDFASNIFWMPFIFWGTYFYTDVFAIPAGLVGVMFLVSRIFDTANDPIMGAIADRLSPKEGIGQYRPFLLRLAVPFGLIGAAAFFTPNAGEGARIAYAFITYLLFGMIYTGINIPYSALMSVISKDPGERKTVSFFRMIGAQGGGLFVSLAIPALVLSIGKGDEKIGYFGAMSLMAVLAVICWFVTYKNTRERTVPDKKVKGEGLKDFASVFSNIHLWLLFIVAIFTNTAFTIRFSNVAYYFKYYADTAAVDKWGGQGVATGNFFFVGTIASLAGVGVMTFFIKRIDKKKLYVILMALAAAVSAYFYFIPKNNIFAIYAAQIVFSFLTGPTAAILFAMYTDIAAYIKHKNGKSSDGLVMSVGSLSQKSGWAIGGSVAPILLAFAGYKAGITQGEDALKVMQYMMSWIPMAPCVLGALAMLFYPLTDAKVAQITAELEQRG
ncbi:MAG: MFS transporter [Deltaproteobacteria bacterium]|nr:MFS transporter [Deltaproteobacteria bacterium]MBN2671359.1 MFS transporter [Deltaproteobacteria bacterium]